MNTIKKYLQSIRQLSSPESHVLKHEMEAVRESQAAVSEELGVLREDLQCMREADAQQVADLQRMREADAQQVADLQRTREADAQQVADLQRTHEADAQQVADLLRTHEAEVKQVADLQRMREADAQQIAALHRTHEADAQVTADLNRQVAQIETVSSKSREHIGHLERSLTTAGQRQQATETKLEEERTRHETSLQATENTLTRILDEQQSLRSMHSELATTVHDAVTRQLESVQAERKKSHRSLLMLIVTAALMFAGGTLVGIYTMQRLEDSRQKIAMLKQDIRDKYVNIKQHIDDQDVLLNELKLTVISQAQDEPVPVEEKPQEDAAQTQMEGKQLPKNVSFTPDIRELQTGLIGLGFDLGMSQSNGELGIKTRQALQEFRQFYLPQDDLPQDVIGESLVTRILKTADLVRMNAARFNIRKDVLAAIRLGSIRTGVDFSFLMELARVESNFNPTARAPRSTATGLFQFRDHTWLETIRTFGADYGLKDYTTRLELIEDVEHEQQPIVRDPLQLEVLALRLNPRLSTLMATENIKRNLWILTDRTGRKPGRTDLYLSHYLGTDGAVTFLKALDERPDAIAGDIFPEEAARDTGVFQTQQGRSRTLAEVYRWFDRKFDTGRYDERNPG